MSENLQLLKAQMARIERLTEASNLLGWDQQTYMPPGAARARAEQMAVLAEVAHNFAASEEYGSLLARSESDLQGMDPDHDDVRLLKAARRTYDRITKLPADFVAEMSRQSTLSMGIWQKAREDNDFVAFIPALKRMFDLARQQAEYLGYQNHPYDALLDAYEPGATQASIAAMFSDLKPALVQLTHAISNATQVEDSLLHNDFPIDTQKQITLKIVKALGYDLNRGRQDEAVHPFCTNFSRDDVRITTRFDAHFLSMALYASLHEAGHGMYEQGIPARFDATDLGRAASLGVHESQSRLWENLVGRSRAFSKWAFPQLQAGFPNALGGSDAESYYRAINRVEPSFIRVEADEVTYNLHILLRFELETALLTNTLAVEDLPEAWNSKMQSYLGITPPDFAQGVLQDVHWSIGLIGYFPTYSIGNLLSAQLWYAAKRALPDLDAQIERGEFTPLLDWLHTHVHGYGAKYLPAELVVKATGEPLSASCYRDYLTHKFHDIYGLA